MAKASRSQFIEKLHALLESSQDPENLRWISKDAFEITCHDGKARAALSPTWDFRSLSSFIRQLSYYNFKRLSDRRRSSERRASATGYIVFSHPSGFFVQGDPSRLNGIVRKTRNRPEKGVRRDSASSALSQGTPPPLMRQPLSSWPGEFRPQGYQYSTHPYDSRTVPPYSQWSAPPLQAGRAPMRTYGQGETLTWRPHSTSWNHAQTNSHPYSLNARQSLQRRSSSTDFKPSMTLGSPRQKQPESGVEHPRLRKAVSTLSLQPIHSSIPDTFRQPYPTPTFTTTAPYSLAQQNHRPGDSLATGLALPYDQHTGYSNSSFYDTTESTMTLPSPTASVYSRASGGGAGGGDEEDESPRYEHQQVPPSTGGVFPNSSTTSHQAHLPPAHHEQQHHLDPRQLLNPARASYNYASQISPTSLVPHHSAPTHYFSNHHGSSFQESGNSWTPPPLRIPNDYQYNTTQVAR